MTEQCANCESLKAELKAIKNELEAVTSEYKQYKEKAEAQIRELKDHGRHGYWAGRGSG
ncbi:MAG: hypothetical protein HW384_857 [Dehalococcoidia bacterium]|nr:hypothetical protein [Dehalococcoidia bacterium]